LVIGLKDNSERSIIEAVKIWYRECLAKVKAWYGDQNRVPISLLADNLEFQYSGVKLIVSELGILQYYTAPAHSSSNGVAERGIGIIRMIARAILKAKDLPMEFWELAVKHACFIANRVPFMYEGRFQRDPYNIWTERTFDYSRMRIFGSKCYALRTDMGKDFSRRADMGIFVGHADNSNAYLVYVPSSNKIISTENIRFYERATDVFAEQITPVEVDSLSDELQRQLNF
jgi:hypothetical protein